MTAHLVAPLIGLALLATMTTACSATTSSASTAAAPAPASGEGSALAKESTDELARGELIGTGVGAAAGAIYVVKKRSSR
ncbi:MAG TPA: hypothetical protein VMR23_01600 [Candidatus Limnocylindria bacterium]|nr:hypothetical protein [Candidatus Limnocylindria bacterium]